MIFKIELMFRIYSKFRFINAWLFHMNITYFLHCVFFICFNIWIVDYHNENLLQMNQIYIHVSEMYMSQTTQPLHTPVLLKYPLHLIHLN